MGRVWHPRRDSCDWPVTALEFPWVTVAPLLIGVTSKEGRGCSGVHLGHCSYGARIGRCMASLGTRVGLAGGAGAGSNCTIFSGKVSLGAPPPSLLSVLPNLLSWSGGKLQASLREKGVAFQATISGVSRLRGELLVCRTDGRTEMPSPGSCPNWC